MLADIVGDARLGTGIDGRVVYMPCGDQPATDDCEIGGWYTNDGEQNACNGGLEADLYLNVGGDPGVEYKVLLHFYGIVEPKNYGSGVSRVAGSDRPDLDGGTPYSWAVADGGHSYPGSNANTYEFRIRDENGDEIQVYYLNADIVEGNFTLIVDYDLEITLVGGGSVHFRVSDPDCHQIKNCGTSPGFPCAAKVRDLDTDDVWPALPSHFDKPALGVSTDHAGQWILIDAVALVQ